MALTSINQKLAVMEWCSIWEPGLPLSPGSLGQDDQQQLIWDNPSPTWGEVTVFAGAAASAWVWDRYVR